MKILGIRNSPTKVRYALLENGEDLAFLNASTENRLVFPKTAKFSSDKVFWLKRELVRILEANSDIIAIGLKVNENISTRYDRVRETAYFDAIAILVGKERGIDVEAFQYSKLPGTSNTIASKMADIISTTESNWDTQMADALAAAWKVSTAL